MFNFKECAYWNSVFDLAKLPHSDGEVVFIGRSNVGKSSTINSLLKCQLSRISQRPGKTNSINFFSVDKPPLHFLVDLPGYGFAKTNHSLLDFWHKVIPQYLAHRNEIKLLYVLIDSRRGDLMPIDLQALEMVLSYRHQIAFILTKVDKLKPMEVQLIPQKILSTLDKNYGINANTMDIKIYSISNNNSKAQSMQQLRQDIHEVLYKYPLQVS